MEITNETIEKIRDVVKIQQMGIEKSGEAKLMVYLPKGMQRKLNLVKGDKLLIEVYKIGHEDTIPKQANGYFKIKKELERTDLTTEEKGFLETYNKAKDNAEMSGFLKEQAKVKFGEERLNEILKDTPVDKQGTVESNQAKGTD